MDLREFLHVIPYSHYLKATIDSLVKCEFCVDDEQFDELVVRRGNVIKGGLLKIKVMEI